MHVVVFGAGAIGGVVGGRLFEAGVDVTLVARGDHHDAIRDRGLRIDDPERSVTLPVPVVDRAARLGWRGDDVVLLTVKSHQTIDALDALRAVAPPHTPIVCVQNGVANERRALRRFPDVHAICVQCPASHLEPGVVEASAAPVTGIFDIGRYPAGVDDLDERLAATLTAARLESVARTDIMALKHLKLLMNLGNALEALCPPGPERDELGRRARREGRACFEAAGVEVASKADDDERRKVLHVAPVNGRTRGGGSSWQSLQRRSGQIETDYLTGEIVLLGRLHGVATPVNEVIQRLAVASARAGEPPGSHPAAEIEAQIEAGIEAHVDEVWPDRS